MLDISGYLHTTDISLMGHRHMTDSTVKMFQKLQQMLGQTLSSKTAFFLLFLHFKHPHLQIHLVHPNMDK